MTDKTQLTLCPLPTLHFIEVTGDDSEKFLNAQFSQIITSKGLHKAKLAAWHDAKGRVMALTHIFPKDNNWILLLHGDNPQNIIQQLKLFILREDVQINDVTYKWFGAIVLGNIDQWVKGCIENLNQAYGNIVKKESIFLFKLSNQVTYLLAKNDKQSIIKSEFVNIDERGGEIAEIRAGLVYLTSDLNKRFTPQMLNLDQLGALSFRKGCYPGQEIITRIKHLGNPKRRLFRFSAPLTKKPVIGSQLLNSSGTPVGEVVRSVKIDQAKTEFLAVIKIESANKPLHLDNEAEITITKEKLP